MLTTELSYELPPELIAQKPVEPRDSSRLMVVRRDCQSISHRRFHELSTLLGEHDLLVANDSRVIPARLNGIKPTGGKVELLLLRKLDAITWLGLVGGRNVRQVDIVVGESHIVTATVMPQPDDAGWIITFSEPIDAHLNRVGEMPLPPYIHESLNDPSRYQTVYARISGSAAAPTAGLHFTPKLIEALGHAGIRMAFVTLHVGLDTFKPISEDTVEAHKIHSEWCELPAETADAIAGAKANGGRVVAVGTTSARVLETVASGMRETRSGIHPFHGFTKLYITPGYQFGLVDAIITNFHLPKSTLLAMIGAFMGMDLMNKAYAEAIQERYRFYSFGDAMLIL
ncbi:MAG: tRNA preQ1(34) S-adenosylmethionine ribosyltransferase-isomerase QueA [Chloroflexi bacterium]|nr:tRNA preQ1(34) S-adenosylmethionine ribosyltransferase-isomerase QueA [Chloroflexota bacterium]